jgi:hypothetical protein
LAAPAGISRDGLGEGIVFGSDYVMKKERLPFALRQLLYSILGGLSMESAGKPTTP